MRSYEFLTETTEDDVYLNQIATSIVEYIFGNYDNIMENPGSAVDLGVIGDFYKGKDYSDYMQEFLNIPIITFLTNDFDGYFGINDGEKTIAINKRILEGDQDRADTVVIHELRHALDDAKSNGNASRQNTKYRSSNKDYSDENQKTKVSSKSEINARVAEAQRELKSMFGDQMPNASALKQEIDDLLERHNIIQYVNNAEYKRIVNRLVSYLSR
jgi:hypothetical protein